MQLLAFRGFDQAQDGTNASALVIIAGNLFPAKSQTKLTHFPFMVRCIRSAMATGGTLEAPARSCDKITSSEQFSTWLGRNDTFPDIRSAAAQDRFQVREVGDVNDLIDALDKSAHGVVGGEAMTEQNDKVFAPMWRGFADIIFAESDSSRELSL